MRRVSSSAAIRPCRSLFIEEIATRVTLSSGSLGRDRRRKNGIATMTRTAARIAMILFDDIDGTLERTAGRVYRFTAAGAGFTPGVAALAGGPAAASFGCSDSAK